MSRWFLLLALAAGLVMAGCPVNPNLGVTTVPAQTVYLSQPAPVVVQPPSVVVQRPAVVVRQPVYVSRPRVLTPVRVSVPYQVARRVCVPGTTRVCDAYCGHGHQTCRPNGLSWTPCVEDYENYIDPYLY